jgi:ferredoxin, 2Fe-2S
MVRVVVVDKDGTEVAVDGRAGVSLMENIRALPRSVEALCGGMCACSTCHVLIDAAWCARLPPRRYEETLMLEGLAWFDAERSRLACQVVLTAALDGLRLAVAPDEG